jgi:hypothetical protein
LWDDFSFASPFFLSTDGRSPLAREFSSCDDDERQAKVPYWIESRRLLPLRRGLRKTVRGFRLLAIFTEIFTDIE